MPRKKELPTKLTKAEVVALRHVAMRDVYQQFTAHGNVFRGPKGTASQTWRKLQDRRLIEGEPRTGKMGAYITNVPQRLTAVGCAALAEYEGE